jgi:pimeloyl-ACP methyl ester carboxylesterase
LFVHGFPFDRTMWRHQLAGLSRWKRIAPDLRGAGESSPGTVEYSMGRYADDLVAVLDAVGVSQAVVCGLSLGGYILFELLRRFPERVRGVVLCDTRPQADSAEGRRSRDELAALAVANGPGAVAERMLPGLLGPATLADQPEVMTQCREMARRCSVPGIVGALRAMRERPDSTPLLGTIRVPTLVVVGAEDRTTPPAVAEAMAQAIPGARYAVIPGAGHIAPLEQPLATSRVIGEFLEAVG